MEEQTLTRTAALAGVFGRRAESDREAKRDADAPQGSTGNRQRCTDASDEQRDAGDTGDTGDAERAHGGRSPIASDQWRANQQPAMTAPRKAATPMAPVVAVARQ
jgi:hypothetical protein